MALTPQQLQQLLAIVDRHHSAFIANFISPAALTPATLNVLRAAGLVDPKATSVREAYLMGMVAQRLAPGATADYGTLAAMLARDPIPLSRQEEAAVATAQLSAGQYISGLGAKVAGEVGAGLMQVDQAARTADRQAVADSTAQAIARRRGTRALASDLGHRTGDWARSLERVANTELATAYQAGTVSAIASQHGAEARVAKVVAPNACALCRALLLDDDGRPKIFSLAELEANGTNVGRKAAEAKAVTGPIHPNCLLPGQPVTTGRGERAVEYLRPGDWVLTHRGRWRAVLRTWRARYVGEAVSVRIRGAGGGPLWVTADHRLWTGRGLCEARDLVAGAQLAALMMVAPPPPPRAEPTYLAALEVLRAERPPLRWRLLLSTPWAIYASAPWTPVGAKGAPLGHLGADDEAAYTRQDGLQATFRAVDDGLVQVGGEMAWPHKDLRTQGVGRGLLLVKRYAEPHVGKDMVPCAPSAPGWRMATQQVVPVRRDADLLVMGEPPPRNATASPPSPRQVPRRVAEAQTKLYDGWVHSLQVEEDATYQSGPLYSSNCACTLVRVPPGTAFNDAGLLVAARGDA